MNYTRYTGKHPGRMGVLGLLAVMMLVVLAACGGTDTANPPATVAPAAADSAMPGMTDTAGTASTASTPAAGTSSGGGTAVQATLREWAIDLSQAEVAAGPVHFTVTNAGSMPHNLTVTLNGATVGATSTFGSSAGPQTLDVTLQPGTYTLICSLPGHAQRGQKVSLVVK